MQHREYEAWRRAFATAYINRRVDTIMIWEQTTESANGSRNVRRILVRGVNAPLPPEAKKI